MWVLACTISSPTHHILVVVECMVLAYVPGCAWVHHPLPPASRTGGSKSRDPSSRKESLEKLKSGLCEGYREAKCLILNERNEEETVYWIIPHVI